MIGNGIEFALNEAKGWLEGQLFSSIHPPFQPSKKDANLMKFDIVKVMSDE
jgi:hypothetical protein